MNRDIERLIAMRKKIEEANQLTIKKMMEVSPILTDIMRLDELHPELKGKKVLTHSGPPITWERMCGGQRGAVLAACLYEGWANSIEEVSALVERGELTFLPNHSLDGVCPMGGVLSPNMQVFVVEDRITRLRTYSCIEYDSFFGAFDAEAVAEIHRWNIVYYPSIKKALKKTGGLALKPIMTQALTMGDELHSRQVAASAVLAKNLAAPITETSPSIQAAQTQKELAQNELTFLPLAMCASKLAMLNASNIPYSTVTTTMSRNGTDFGIRVSATGDTWFVAPSPQVDTVLFPGYKKEDEGLDMGDSAITETNGLGGFSFAAAPAISGVINATAQNLIDLTLEMRDISVGRNPAFSIPMLDFAGAACGIDIRKVVQLSVAPIIDTATAHKEPGHRIVGVGMTRAPMACFQQAMEAWFQKYNI